MTRRGCAGRYDRRQSWWEEDVSLLPRVRHRAWWVMHNCVSHPALGVAPTRATVWFHDWTSMKLNRRPRLHPSPTPVIPNQVSWIHHNVVVHMAIGLFPMEWAFRYHDETCHQMGVKHWV